MRYKFAPVLRNAKLGVTVTEFAVLLGLVILLGYGGLQLLGGSISTVLGQSGSHVASNPTLQMLAPFQGNKSGASGLGLKGTGFFAIGLNPTTGQPELMTVNGSQAVATNVSSIDGSKMNTLGGIMLAKGLEQLAEQQTDPTLADYYGKMARAAYYLAGAEGELDGIPGLDITPPSANGGTYTKGDAVNDITKFSAELSSLMNNPPANLNTADFLQAMPLATGAFNISKQYENAYSQFIGPDGQVAQNFGLPSACGGPNGGCPVGNGAPGSALSNSSQVVADLSGATLMIHQSYDQLQSYSQLQAAADAVLTNNQVQDVPVVSTITDSQGLVTVSQNQ